MIKRTLLFANPVYLNTTNNQLVVTYPQHNNKIPKAKRLKELPTNNTQKTVPLEDIGVIILEHPQITITNRLLEQLTLNNVAIINCNQQHLPIAMLQPLSSHSEFNQRLNQQLQSSTPLKKQLWQQTIIAKINNQAAILAFYNKNTAKLKQLAKNVKSGDTTNNEAQAAAHYWKHLMTEIPGFYRHQQGPPPNNLLNYGYAILRGITARALIASGLLPALGIFHQNKYNAYCLADDIMEPYRPYVDFIVMQIIENTNNYTKLTTEIKQDLLQIITIDTHINNKKSPLMIAMSRTTNSLYECFAGVRRKILYPEINL